MKFYLLVILFSVTEVTPQSDHDNPVAFHMFEHHELCKESFIKEHKIVEDLRTLRKSLDTRRKQIKSFSTMVLDKNDINLLGHIDDTIDPLNSLQLLKRSTLYLPNVRHTLKNDLELQREILTSLNETSVNLPTIDDFNGAVKGLVMLQETYNFYLRYAAEGRVVYVSSDQRFHDFVGREKLEVEDFIRLSEKAKSQMLFDIAIQFLQVGYFLAETNPPDKSTKKKMKTLKKELVYMNNQHLIKWGKMLGKNYKVFPYLIDNDMNPKEDTPQELIESAHSIEIVNEYHTDFCFKQVCRNGAFVRGPDTVNLPKCGFLHHFNPYLRLGPFKVEVIQRSPYLSILHGILSEEEIKWMIDYSTPRLSKIRDNHKIGFKEDKMNRHDPKKRRVIHKTVQCWINEVKYDEFKEENDPTNYTIKFPLMFKLAQKLELATQMNITGKYSATEFQTTNYGLGGLCEKHLDPHGYIEGAEVTGGHKSLIQSGDMIATVMAWLGDVEGGGGTAFVHHKVEKTLMPTRGSAAFWYDLDRKGYRDQRTLHGGCPIIKGAKWILNKWIYYYNQHKKYPCAMNRNEYMTPPQGYYRNILNTQLST